MGGQTVLVSWVASSLEWGPECVTFTQRFLGHGCYEHLQHNSHSLDPPAPPSAHLRYPRIRGTCGMVGHVPWQNEPCIGPAVGRQTQTSKGDPFGFSPKGYRHHLPKPLPVPGLPRLSEGIDTLDHKTLNRPAPKSGWMPESQSCPATCQDSLNLAL